MKKQLFFDDSKLFGRDNFVRKYGKPEIVAEYHDGISSTDYATGYVFLLDNGKYRMLYFAHGTDFEGKKLFAAISEDGTHFTPEKLFDLQTESNKKYEHEIMNVNGEPACIFEDKYTQNPCERYKMLFADYSHMDELRVEDTVYTSPDLINWSLKEGSIWGDGTEPLANVFYNNTKKVYTILERPFWGQRCVGYKETTDWETFTEFRHCLNVDSSDDRLDEIYGMYAFAYDGMFIGIPHLYRHLNSEFNAKYKNGIIDTQLAYSYDGRYWCRSLREPFISGIDRPDKAQKKQYPLIWVSTLLQMPDGSVNLYASASELEHGPAFHNPGKGSFFIYNMRKDGFISLCTEDPQKTASLITREKVWHSGELCVNLKAKKATVAVYVSDESEHVSGNVLGIAKPLDGYGHEDCIPFEGDCTEWIPQYKTGKKVDDLKGKTIVFELRLLDGEVFSISGDYTDLFNTQAARYRRFGILPEA